MAIASSAPVPGPVRNSAPGFWRKVWDNPRLGAGLGLLIIILGAAIGQIGTAIMGGSNGKDGAALLGVGTAVRGLGTLWSAVCLVLSIQGRERGGNGAAWKNELTTCLWIVTLGVVTMFNDFLPLDFSFAYFIAFIGACTVVYAAGAVLGKDSIPWAFWMNLAAIAGISVILFFHSRAWALMSGREGRERRACLDYYLENGAPSDSGRKAFCDGALGTKLAALASEISGLRQKELLGREKLTLEMKEQQAQAMFDHRPFSMHLAACADGIDNDGDGYADFDGGPSVTSELAVPVLDDKGKPVKNPDGTAKTEKKTVTWRHRPDPGCSSYADDSERDKGLACDDGQDNDGDGGPDNLDRNCFLEAGDCSPQEKAEGKSCRDIGQGGRVKWARYMPAKKETPPPKAESRADTAKPSDKPAASLTPAQIMGQAAKAALEIR